MQTINLNQNSFRLFPTIYMVQNDTGRELKMILDDVTLDGTETGAVAIKRSDGSYYTITATIDATNNAFDADMTQALTQPSRTECQLKVTASDDTVISTYTFIIMVQPSTDGISEEQLGYSVQQLRQDAEDIRTGGMPAALRLALLQIAQKVAYIDENGAQYYQDLYDALAPSAILTGITAVYTQSGTVYDTDSLDDLKADLVVTAAYSDGTTETLLASAYTLSGTLAAGTDTITVTYEDKTDTFSVTVTLDRVGRFGNFTNQRAISKANTSSVYPQYVPFAYVTNSTITARACISVPVANNGYTFTVTDAAKYSINVVDVTSDTAISVPNYTDAKDRIIWSAGTKTVGWNTTDSVTTDFLFIALKKNDNTNFTDAELANAAEAVFTFTES